MNLNAKIERSFNLSGSDFHNKKRPVAEFLGRMAVMGGVVFVVALVFTIAERGA